ncbi:bifunctional diguanylate cyclase/phosphodiesterase [Ferroacidibacillus organovorans]|uniref:Diguanylate cyclase n=1 Tax=Ferroacidibacillus organovorans TaxID=1765683 RepID=A0A853KIE2_9BACL|nr:EAL domain-containing protein [Ferroacidibacillus organovorans]KYP81353.1 hypothetical protein AYJ22_00885 [Ferroacidibacillus organovorans]OAG95140.1 hypothetical protein AYW79_01485 [Ferroacidibacillus organovorans]
MLGITLNERLQIASSKMLTMLSQMIDVNTLFVAIHDEQTNEIIKVYNRTEALMQEGAMPFRESYCHHVCKSTADVLIIPDTTLDERTATMTITSKLGATSFIGVPIVLKHGWKVGTICGMDRTDHAFSEKEIEALHVAAVFVGYVIELERMAYVDDVTGVFTRKFLQESFQGLANQHSVVCMFVLDIDHFKMINDRQGHEFGDKVLRVIAKRIHDALYSTGILFRLGGDEFALMSSDPTNRKEALTLAQQVLDLFSSPFAVDGMSLFVTASIGVSWYPECGVQLQELLRYADMAMYSAKHAGGNCIKCYDPQQEAAMRERLDLEERLRYALEHEELEIHYQPKILVKDGSIQSIEALTRWRDASGAWISPERFISIAEESALIVMLGRWVLLKACRQFVTWEEKGKAPALLSVNVSPKQFQLGNMVQTIREVIQETGMDPQCLAIEITEGLLMHNSMEIAEELRVIRSLGVKIAIDDFGKGFSSLSYLHLFQPTHLKIDKSFIDHMLHDPGQMSIVSAVIHLAHNLNMSVIAEGVENMEQFNRLKAEGCDYVQGYLFAKPLPAEEIERFASSYLKHGDKRFRVG